MTSTITLYKLPQNILGKNNQYDSWSTYLSNVSSSDKSIISNFQYIKIQLEVTIKLNMAQSSLPYSFGFNYVSIVQDSMTYYFLIKKARQIAESTIELELHMDVLNTYQFNQSGTAGNTYTLLPSTLVTREHKNRLSGVGQYVNVQDVTPNGDLLGFQQFFEESGYFEENIASTLMIKVSDLVDILGNNPSGLGQLLLWYAKFVQYDDTHKYEGTILLSFDDSIYYRTSGIGFEGNSRIQWTSYDEDTSEEHWDYSKMLSEVQYIYIRLNITRPEEDFSVSYNEDWGNDASWQYTANTIVPFMISRVKQRTYVRWKRIIDKYPENIGSQLFKRGEFELVEGGKTANWYMLYQNANNVTSDDSTAPDVVNPVKLMFVSSESQTIPESTGTATPKVVEASDQQILPPLKNRQEAIFVRYKDRDGTTTPEVTIGGTTYTLVNAQAIANYGTNQYTMIMFRRAGNSDNYFSGIYGYRIKPANPLNPSGEPTQVEITELGTNIGSFTIKGINYIYTEGIFWNNMYNASNYYTRYDYESTMNPYFIGSGIYTGTGTATAVVLKNFSELDLTNPKNVKLISIPFSPVAWNIDKTIPAIPDGYAINSSMNLIEVTNLARMNFKRTITFSDILSPMSVMFVDHTAAALSHTDAKSHNYESKLFHSDFYQPKFVYDSYSFIFRLECVDTSLLNVFKDDTGDFTVTYVVSKNMASRFMFTFTQYVCGSYETQDYNNILIVDRNNEVTLFTNEYMNYLKLGYNFDTKRIQKSNEMNWLGVALSMAGAFASFVSSGATHGAGIVGGVSLMTTAIGMTTRAINTAQENDRSLAQKMNQLALQSTSVNANSDIDLLFEYTNLRPKLCYYSLSDMMENAVYDLFFYCGYATREYKVPSITSRINFNFVQAEVNFKRFEFSEEIGNEIKAKWKEGITFFHTYNGTYDFNQEYENWESSLIS